MQGTACEAEQIAVCRMLSSRAWGTVDCIDGGWLQGAVMRNMFIFTLTMLTSAKVLPATFFPNYGNLLIELV